MRRTVTAVLAAALAVPGVVAAKGPTSATVTGPGLDHPIALTGGGHPGSAGTLGRVANHAGFFQAAFGTALSSGGERPDGDLGPRYTVTYRLGPDDVIRQDGLPLRRAHGGRVHAAGPALLRNHEDPGRLVRLRPPV